MPIRYDVSSKELDSILSKINGLYIPGDHVDIVEDRIYAKHFKMIISKVDTYNSENAWFVPVFCIKYGYLNLLYNEVKNRDNIVSNTASIMHAITLPIKLVAR